MTAVYSSQNLLAVYCQLLHASVACGNWLEYKNNNTSCAYIIFIYTHADTCIQWNYVAQLYPYPTSYGIPWAIN